MFSIAFIKKFLAAYGMDFNGIKATGGRIEERFLHRGKKRRYNYRHGIRG